MLAEKKDGFKPQCGWVKEQATSSVTTDKVSRHSDCLQWTLNGTPYLEGITILHLGRDHLEKGRQTPVYRILGFCSPPKAGAPQAWKLRSVLEHWPSIISMILDLKLQKAHNEKPEIQLQNELQRKQETSTARTNLPVSGNSFFNYFAAHS